MRNDELEFSISQYLDGSLADVERAVLEDRLKSDPQAQRLCDDHRRIHAALKAMPLPAVQWDALARSISAAVAAAQEDPAPRVYHMPTWIRAAIPLALAASVMILAFVGLHRMGHFSGTSSVAIQTHPIVTPQHHQDGALASESSVFVIGPASEVASGPSVEQVTIGPSPVSRTELAVMQYSDDVVSRPSSVTIASGVVPTHESAGGLQFDME